MLPQAYVYPAGMRATRDLLRRRLHLVRKRGQLLAHIQMTNQQYNLPAFAKRIAYPSNRAGVADHFEDRVVRKNVAVDLALLDRYDTLLVDLESYLVRQAKQHDPQAFQLLRSIPGVGKVLALTILYEIYDVKRFDRVQEFASYARLVKCAKESAGKKHGTSGAKMGNVHLKWAFSEAAVLFVRHSEPGKKLLARLEKRVGKGKALSILAHKLGRAAYYMLRRGKAFEIERFVATVQ
jgi:transposase